MVISRGVALLEANHLSKWYPQNADHNSLHALSDVSFVAADGEFLALVGPSGSGKSTLLRLLAGLLPPDDGVVNFDGAALVAPRADIGLVFQEPNLMPWRTTLENIALPLEIQGATKMDALNAAKKLSDLMGLQGFEAAFPQQLSGGMQQRVALARALIHKPRLLLLDEPFGALDALTRERMNVELLRIWQLYHATAILVTHSISEAVFLADRVLVLSARPGRVTTTVDVLLPRPRTLDLLTDDRFVELTRAVRHAIDASASLWPGPPV